MIKWIIQPVYSKLEDWWNLLFHISHWCLKTKYLSKNKRVFSICLSINLMERLSTLLPCPVARAMIHHFSLWNGFIFNCPSESRKVTVKYKTNFILFHLILILSVRLLLSLKNLFYLIKIKLFLKTTQYWMEKHQNILLRSPEFHGRVPLNWYQRIRRRGKTFIVRLVIRQAGWKCCCYLKHFIFPLSLSLEMTFFVLSNRALASLNVRPLHLILYYQLYSHQTRRARENRIENWLQLTS